MVSCSSKQAVQVAGGIARDVSIRKLPAGKVVIKFDRSLLNKVSDSLKVGFGVAGVISTIALKTLTGVGEDAAKLIPKSLPDGSPRWVQNRGGDLLRNLAKLKERYLFTK